MPDVMTKEQQAHLMETTMASPEGRIHVAHQMMEPIKAELDYIGIGRNGFIKDVLMQGDAPYYDKDVKVPAVTLSKRGATPQIRREGDRVWADIFPLASMPLIPIEDTRLRRYNILDRVQVKARADLAEEEDVLIFGSTTSDGVSITSVYKTAADTTAATDRFTGGNTTQTSTDGVTRDVLALTAAEIYQRNLIPAAILMHPRQYVDMWLWGRDEFDPETQRQVLETGRMGSLWNMEVITSYKMPSGTLYMRTSDEYLGVFTVLIDLDVMDSPDPKGLNYGYTFFEFIGVTVINIGGIARATISYTG